MNEITVRVSKHAGRRYYTMWYVHPVNGSRVKKSTKCTTERDAERVAARWEDELRSGRGGSRQNLTWEEFRTKHGRERLASLAENTQDAADVAFNHLERIINPARLGNITTEVISDFATQLREEGMKETTIGVHLAHLRAALNWAHRQELLRAKPGFEMPKATKGRKLMRGRPIVAEEYERMLTKVADERPRQAAVWKRYLEGLWLSGLRLEESLAVSWDADEPFSVDLTGKHPRFRILAEAHKARRDELLPLTPDFAEFLLATPEDERQGLVFDLSGGGRQLSGKTVGRIVSNIGRLAGVVVDKAAGKYASAHDLRRSFGTRWAPRVRPATLQRLMRHACIETTLRYYVGLEADDVASELWAWSKAEKEKQQKPATEPEEATE